MAVLIAELYVLSSHGQAVARTRLTPPRLIAAGRRRLQTPRVPAGKQINVKTTPSELPSHPRSGWLHQWHEGRVPRYRRDGGQT